jgi:hypothetical protein
MGNLGLAQKEQQAQRGQHHCAEIMSSAVLASSGRVRESRKLLLNDLKLGFDRGEIGERSIDVSQRVGVYVRQGHG